MKRVIFLWIYLIGCFSYVSAQSDTTYRLSTHILNIQEGKPASGVTIILYKQINSETGWQEIGRNQTAENGRVEKLVPAGTESNGIYKLKFETQPYFRQKGETSIYPYIEVVFRLEGEGHYHIPITLSANGYSTYRGN